MDNIPIRIFYNNWYIPYLASEWLGLETVIASHYVNHECDDVKQFVKLVEKNKSKGNYAPKTIVMKNEEEIELN